MAVALYNKAYDGVYEERQVSENASNSGLNAPEENHADSVSSESISDSWEHARLSLELKSDVGLNAPEENHADSVSSESISDSWEHARLSLELKSDVSITHGEAGATQTFSFAKHHDNYFEFHSHPNDTTPPSVIRSWLGENLPLMLITLCILSGVYFALLRQVHTFEIETATFRVIIFVYIAILFPNVFIFIDQLCMLGWLFLYPDPDAECPPMDEYPLVTVLLPVYNEMGVVVRLLDAVCNLDWPADKLEIQVVSNSTDETDRIIEETANKWRARGILVNHLHREDKMGFKAGNLNLGIRFATGEFIAMLDASNIPYRNWLKKTVPYFSSSDVGVVQSRWDHHNLNSNFLTRIQGMLYDEPYSIHQESRYRRGTFLIFNGQSGIWRKRCLDDVSGFPITTITEDVHISYMAQMKDWKIVFRHDSTVKGELPETVSSWLSQQYRWCKGHIQVAPSVVRYVFASKLSPILKCLCMLDILRDFGFLFLFMLLAILPVVAQATHIIQLHLAEKIAVTVLLGVLLLITAVSHWVAFRACGRHPLALVYLLPLMLMVQAGMVVNQAAAVIDGLISREAKFVVRKKKGSGSVGGSGKPAIAFLTMLMGGYYVAAIIIQFEILTLEIAPVYVLVALGCLLVGLELWLEALVYVPNKPAANKPAEAEPETGSEHLSTNALGGVL
eukprot:264894_1